MNTKLKLSCALIVSLCISLMCIAGTALVVSSEDALPDIVVTGITTPERVYANISNTITATVGNIGNVNTSAFKVRFILNDSILCEKTVTTVLAAAANTSISFDWTPTHAGSYTINITADPDDEITELDETNNTKSLNVTAFLISETELAITEVKTTDTICVGELNPVRVLVKNLGMDAGEFDVTLYADGVHVGTKRMPSLAFNTVTVVGFGWVPGGDGSYTLNATESETNDWREADVSVAPAPVWNHSANITIAHGGALLPGHQILLTLDPSIFDYNLTGDDGRDIAFRDGGEDGDPLPYWAPEWNTSGESRIRIRLNIPPGGKTITMLYGNSTVSSGSDGYLVFDFYDDFEAGLDGWQSDAVLYGDGDYNITTVSDAGSLDGSDHAARIEIKRLTGIAGLYRNMTLPIPYYFDFGMMVECDTGTPEAGVFVGEGLLYDVPKLYATGEESPWASHSIDLSNWTDQTVGIGFYGMNSWWRDYHVNISIDNARLRNRTDPEPFVDYGYADIIPIAITPRFANLYANFTNRIYATVANDGTADARNFSVSLFVDGAEVDSCEMTIPYKSNETVEFEWNPPIGGNYTLTVDVDTGETVDETCETNNNRTLNVSVNPELVWGCAFQEEVYLRPIGTEPVGATTGLLTLDPSIFDYANANPDGSDIRIKDGNGTDLSYWIERWNTSGESVIWFGANISQTGKTVYLCYGNSSAQSGSNASAVTVLFEDWEDGDASLARWNFNWSHTSGGWGSRSIDDAISVTKNHSLNISAGLESGTEYSGCDNQKEVEASYSDFTFSGWLYPEQLSGDSAYSAYVIDLNVSGNPYHLLYGAFNYEPTDTSDTFYFPLFTAGSGWHHLHRSLREDLAEKGIDVAGVFSVENVSQRVHTAYYPYVTEVATAHFDNLVILPHTPILADLGYADLAPVSIAPTLDQFYANCTRNPIIVTIENNGTADARDFNVSLSIDGDPLGVKTCSIAHKGNRSLAFNWTPPHIGDFQVCVEVDSVDVVNETDESNNNQTGTLIVNLSWSPDLAISDLGIPDEVRVNQTLAIETVVANLGGWVGAFNLSLYVDGAVVLNRTVNDLGPEETVTVNFTWTPGSVREYDLKIVLDPDCEIQELDEDNNNGTATVTVVAPDLVLAVIEPSGYYRDYTNRINVAVTNNGTASADGFNVTFRVNGTAEGDMRIEHLDKNETTEVSFDWTPFELGNHNLTIEVDGDCEIEESNEENNNVTRNVNVTPAPEFEIVIIDVTTKNHFYANTANMIDVTIRNNGTRSESFNVTLSDGDMLVETRIEDISPHTNTSVRFAWVPRETEENLPKNCTLVIEADSGGEINESDETNNDLTLGNVTLEHIAIPPSPALIRGNASYEDGGLCTKFNAEITKRNDTFAANTSQGSSYYRAILLLYPNDTYPEPCMIRVTATDDGGSVNVTDHNMTAEEVGMGEVVLNVTIPFLLPDINVTRIDLPEQCHINETHTINTTIENIGTDMNLNQSFNVSFLVDGVAVGVKTIGSLNYSETAELSFGWTPDRAGSYDLTIFADSDQEITEAAEYNNNLTVTGASAIAPDLVIEGILINGIKPPYDDVFVNRSNTVDITINNTGTADVDLNAMWGECFSVTLLATKGDATTTADSGSVSKLNKSESKVVSLSWTPAETGNHTLRAVIDSGGVIDESNETNNEFAMNRSVCEPIDLAMVLVSGVGGEYARSFTAPLNCTAYNATMKACTLIGEWVSDSTPVVVDGENITYVAGIPEPQFYIYNETARSWTESDANIPSPQLSDETIFGWTGGYAPPPLPLADVTPTEITMPRTLYLGRMVPVTFTIENNGLLDASSVEVRLDLKHETWANRTPDVASDVVSVDAGGNTPVTLKWLAEESGEYEVRVVLDPSNRLNETDDTNNEIEMTARVIRGLIVDVPRDFQTIQEAVEDAAPDTVIYVHEGRYWDDGVNATMYGGGTHITFTDKKNISLIGDGWATEVDDATINIHNSSGILIDGFNMVRGGFGKGVHITIRNSDNVVINDCKLTQRDAGAAYLYNSSSCRISDCLIHYEVEYEGGGPPAHYGHAIYIAADSRDNLLENNTICKIPLGIRVEGTNNRIYHNNLYQTHFADGTTGSRRRIIASDSGEGNLWDYNYWARYCLYGSRTETIPAYDDLICIDGVCYTHFVKGVASRCEGVTTYDIRGDAWVKSYDMLDADGNGIRDLPYSAPDPQYGDPVIDRHPLTEPYGVDMDARIVGVVVPNRVYANRTNAIFAIVKRTTRDVEPRTFEIAGFANGTKIGNETITLDGYLTAEELGHYAKLTWQPNATGSCRINATVTSEILDVDPSNNLMELDLDVLEPPFEPENLGSVQAPSGSKLSPAWCSIAICAMGTDPHSANWFDNDMKQYLLTQFEFGTSSALRNAGGWAIWTMGIVAAGEDPRNFGGINYLGMLELYYNGESMGNAETGDVVWDDAMALLAFDAAEVGDPEMIENVRNDLIGRQEWGGSWFFKYHSEGGKASHTAIVVQALLVSGVNESSDAVQDGLKYLNKSINDDGSFPYRTTKYTGESQDVLATSHAIQAILAAGENPLDWNGSDTPDVTPVDYLSNPSPVQEKHLFTVPGVFNTTNASNVSEFETALCNGTIPDMLEAMFEYDGRPLTEGASVTNSTEEDDAWILTDAGDKYVLRRTDMNLTVYLREVTLSPDEQAARIPALLGEPYPVARLIMQEEPRVDLRPILIDAPYRIYNMTNCTINGIIRNSGGASPATLLANGVPVDNSTAKSVWAKGATEIDFKWKPERSGEYNLTIASDYYNKVNETDETNNMRTIFVTVTNPDLEPEMRLRSNTVNVTNVIEATIYGTTDESFNVTFLVDGRVINTTRIYGIDGSTSLTFYWRPNETRYYNLTVFADSDTEVEESDETNNYLTKYVPAIKPELFVQSFDVPTIYSNATNPIYLDIGGVAGAFNVSLYVNETNETNETLVCKQMIESLWAEADLNTTLYWKPNRTGQYDVRIFVDSDNDEDERIETNNNLTVSVAVILPDLIPQEIATPAHIYWNETNTINITITNAGDDFNVTLIADGGYVWNETVNATNGTANGMEMTKTPVNATVIRKLTNVSFYRSTTLSFDWIPKRLGICNLTVLVDPDCDLYEANETNNNRTWDVRVVERVPIELLSPRGGEVWEGTENIEWNTTFWKNLTIDIDYSPNRGGRWLRIVSGTDDDGVHAWNTENVSDGYDYLIRVMANSEDAYGEDISNKFTIYNTGSAESWGGFHGNAGFSMSTAPDSAALAWASRDIGANPSSSVCVADGKVFVYCTGGKVKCLGEDDGVELWAADVGSSGSLGSWATPVYSKGNVYMVGSGRVGMDNDTDGDPLPDDSIKAFVLSTIDADTGAATKKYYLVNKTDANGESVNGGVLVAYGTQFFNTYDDGLYYRVGDGVDDVGPRSAPEGMSYCGGADCGVPSGWDWRFEVDRKHATSTPVAAFDSIYFGDWIGSGGDGALYRVSRGTGKEIWNQSLASGVCGSPTVVNGNVYLTTYGFYETPSGTYAFDAMSGAPVWDYVWQNNRRPSDSTPAYAPFDDGYVYVSGAGFYDDSYVVCFDDRDGSIVWDNDKSNFDQWVNDSSQYDEPFGIGYWTNSPVVSIDEKVFVGKPAGEFGYMGLFCLDAKTGKERWHADGGGSTAAIANGRVYTTGEGRVYAYGTEGRIDLVPQEIAVPALVYEKVATLINVTVENIGTDDAGGFDVSLGCGDVEIGTASVGSLVRGGTANVVFMWTPPTAGEYTLQVTVNSDMSVNEDLFNNNMNEDVPVLPTPQSDISITSLTHSSPVLTDESCTISATIVNYGEPASDFDVSLKANDNPVGSPIHISDLSYMESKIVPFTWVPHVSKTYTLTVFADCENTTIESDENNNKRSIDINVTAAPFEPPPPLGLGDGDGGGKGDGGNHVWRDAEGDGADESEAVTSGAETFVNATESAEGGEKRAKGYPMGTKFLSGGGGGGAFSLAMLIAALTLMGLLIYGTRKERERYRKARR